MGVRTKKPVSPRQQVVRKPSVSSGVGGTAPAGCPEAVIVRGNTEGLTVGQRASLVLAGNRVQLVVANRVTPISGMSPSISSITHCLREGARYWGRVARVKENGFEADLVLGGTS